MDLDRIRKQKIDKTYIDEAFKEIPMYESMAVSSEKDTYRLAKELLTMGHITPKQTRKQTNDNLSDASAPTLQSLYLSPGRDDPNMPGQYDASGHSSQRKSENKEVVSLYDDQLNSSERNILPQILRDKPLESPSKARFDPAFSGKIGHTMGVNYIRTESHAIQEDMDEDGFPRMEDIEEFKGKFCDVKRNVMKALVEDLQKKENDYFVINSLKSEKTGKMYPHKMFVVCHSQEAILDSKHIFYKDNFNFLRSKLAPYYSGVELKEDKRQLIYLYMIYQKGKTWEYIKVMVEGTKSTGAFYRHSQYNPFSAIEAIPSEILDRYVEGLLKTLVGPQPVTKKVSKKQRLDKGFSDTRGCSIWDSGVEVYKRISKDYAKLSQEKVSREQMTFLLWERFYERQLS